LSLEAEGKVYFEAKKQRQVMAKKTSSYEQLMALESESGESFELVPYEDLVNDPEIVDKDFLEMFDKACIVTTPKPQTPSGLLTDDIIDTPESFFQQTSTPPSSSCGALAEVFSPPNSTQSKGPTRKQTSAPVPTSTVTKPPKPSQSQASESPEKENQKQGTTSATAKDKKRLRPQKKQAALTGVLTRSRSKLSSTAA